MYGPCLVTSLYGPCLVNVVILRMAGVVEEGGKGVMGDLRNRDKQS